MGKEYVIQEEDGQLTSLDTPLDRFGRRLSDRIQRERVVAILTTYENEGKKRRQWKSNI